MGLDMYLRAERDFWSFNGNEEVELGKDLCQLLGVDGTITPLKNVEVEAGYWRKANHIHKWFVDNVQSGEDNCESYYVDREKLIQLRELCVKVLENNELAPEILPTTQGFFFGSKDYAQWYFNDLADTVKIVDRALALPKEWNLSYRSSW
jgi:hypothetical protein